MTRSGKIQEMFFELRRLEKKPKKNKTAIAQLKNAIVAECEGIVRWVVRRERRAGESDDVLMSDGYAALANAIRLFRPEYGVSITTYVRKAIIHELSNRRRRVGVRLVSSSQIHDGMAGKEDNGQNALENAELAERYLAVLSSDEREIVRRRFGFGCDSQSYREIAAVDGRSRQRIEQVIKSAIAKMRRAASRDSLSLLSRDGSLTIP